jgi:hypothetical protein
VNEPVVFVDTRTNEVTDPAELTDALPALPEPEPREARATAEPRRVPWPLVGAASALALLALALLQRVAKARMGRRPPERAGDELRDPLPDNGHEAPERPKVLVP